MRRSLRTMTAIAAASIATIGLTTTAGSAAQSTWSVSGGTTISGSNTIPVLAEDLDTGTTMTCDTSTATGTAKNGTGLDGAGIAQLNTLTLSDSTTSDGRCPTSVNTLGEVVTLELPYLFNAVSYNAAEGVTTGTLTGVKAELHASDGCDAVVGGPGGGAGQIEGQYDNDTGQLTVLDSTSNNLEVQSVDADCDPFDIGLGDAIALDGVYEISPRLTITME